MMPIDAVDLTRALIRCPSVTPKDAGALDVIEAPLKSAGFTTHRVTFSEPGYPDIDNLFAWIGGEGPCLVFAGHTDVVPPGQEEAWSHPPFAAEIVGDTLYGRGAEDMKGGVAASVAAALNHIESHGIPKTGSIAFLITGDEEGPAVNGTVKLLAWARQQGFRLDHCLLGEPTNVVALGDMIKIGRRGSLSGHITVEGKQGHVAYPERAKNPIPVLARVVSGLLAVPLDHGTAHFAPSNLEFTTVDVGNTTTNVIPARATASFNIRFNDLWSPTTLADEIRRRCDALGEEGIAMDIRFTPTNAVAFVTEPGPFVTLVREAVAAETGMSPTLSTTGGTSDARFIKDACEVLEFGLIGRTMHQVDEHTSITDIRRLTRIYERVIAGYFEAKA